MEQRKGKGGGGGWISLVIFLALAVGSRVAPPLAGWLSQVTGIPVSPAAVVIGAIVLAVAASGLSSALRSIGRLSSGGDTRLPSSPSRPPQVGAPQRPFTPPPTSRGPAAAQTKIPATPQFDPIIDPRVLTLGIVGLLLFGVVFLVILAVSGGI
jgi:hypothetical protein